MDPSTILNIFYAIIGISLIIFIHELGHFLAAKRVGVRVDAFSVGFDPTIFGRPLRLLSFKKGETEYIIGLVPFGGYVKMAGETSMDAAAEKRQPQQNWLVSKTPGERAQVFAAGAVFNIISALFFFMIAFSLGTKFTASSVGEVQPGLPAWRAGVRPGDRVVRVDDTEIRDFNQLIVAVAFGDQERPRQFHVERNGEITGPLRIQPEWDSARGFYTTGIIPNADSRLPAVAEGSAANAAGIEAGDHLVGAELGGTKLILGEELGDAISATVKSALANETADAIMVQSSRLLILELSRFHEESPTKPIRLLVARNDELLWKNIQITEKAKKNNRRQLGVRPIPLAVVNLVQSESDAEGVLQPGDRIVSINGKPYVSSRWTKIAEENSGAATLEIVVENGEGERRTEPVATTRFLSWDMGRMISWTALEARVGDLSTLPQLSAAGLQAGDVIVRAGEQDIRAGTDLSGAITTFLASQLGSLPLQLIRDGEFVSGVEIPREPLGAVKGIPIDETPRILVASSHSAAAKLGIESGSHILRIGDTEIKNWENLKTAVNGSSGEVTVVWRSPAGEEKSGTSSLTPDAYTPLGLALEQKRILVKESPLTSFVLGFERSIVVAKWVYLTLKGLAKQEVAAKNLAGPVGVVHLIVRVSEWGLGTLVYWLALISINLGILNLLPFPILDGGHLLFLLIEKIKGSPVSLKAQEIATTIAFFLIISLAIFVTYNDIQRLLF